VPAVSRTRARRHKFFSFLKIQVVQHDSQRFTLKGVSRKVIQDFFVGINIGILMDASFSDIFLRFVLKQVYLFLDSSFILPKPTHSC
jgi:hypothetical protein